MHAVGGTASPGGKAKIRHLPLSSPTLRRRISILVIHSGHFSKGFPAGTEKANNRPENRRKRMHMEGRVPACITCTTQKSGKTTEGRNAQFLTAAPHRLDVLFKQEPGVSARSDGQSNERDDSAFRRDIFRARSKKGWSPRIIYDRSVRDDNGRWNLQRPEKDIRSYQRGYYCIISILILARYKFDVKC